MLIPKRLGLLRNVIPTLETTIQKRPGTTTMRFCIAEMFQVNAQQVCTPFL